MIIDSLQRCETCEHEQVCKFSGEFASKEKSIKEEYNDNSSISPIHVIIQCKCFKKKAPIGVCRESPTWTKQR